MQVSFVSVSSRWAMKSVHMLVSDQSHDPRNKHFPQTSYVLASLNSILGR